MSAHDHSDDPGCIACVARIAELEAVVERVRGLTKTKLHQYDAKLVLEALEQKQTP